jgi:hypothetical protein
MRSTAFVRTLVILGGVLAALGLVTGHLNREVIDGPRFAHNVDDVRRDEDVARLLGRSISTQLVRANQDLVALRPLVEQVATNVAGSRLLSPPTRRGALAVHDALTSGDGDQLVLRIADAGAIVAAAIGVLVPEHSMRSSDVSVTLASIGSRDFASTTIVIASAIDTLAWLLPLGALSCFAAAVALSRQRWRTATSCGRAVLSAAIVIGLLLLVGGYVVRHLDDDVLSGAVARATWRVAVRPLWWRVAGLAGVGLAAMLACDSSVPEAIARRAARARSTVFQRPSGAPGVVGRAGVAAMIGVAAIIDPIGLLEPVIVLAGVGLVMFAIVEIASLAAAARAESPESSELGPTISDEARSRPRGWSLVVIAMALVVAVGGVILLARPGGEIDVVSAGDAQVCNGHAELCDRSFDDVAYVASHNSMSVAGEPGWFLGEQADPITVQLDQGVRALLIDVWSGQRAGNVVRTAANSHDEALALAEEELGPEVVAAALRIANSVAGEALGPEERFLCHGLCETGSTSFLDTLGELRGWLATNPDEVVTLFIEDYVDASLIADDIEVAGLAPYVYEPQPGEPWPTLAEMIRSNRRLVVMLEVGRGDDAAPWLVNGFDYTQDTPYTFPTVDSFSCDPNRGPDDAPLFLLNHWLFGFRSLVSDARLVNDRDVLLARARECERERGQIPNFVAVNYVAIGDVGEVVDELNGVS